jgi:hypothetical protein
LEPTLFTPFSIGWYVQQPDAPPKTKLAQPGWFSEPIVVPAPPPVNMGWYMQQPDPLRYRPPLHEQLVIAEPVFVMPTVLLDFNGIARVFDVHLVTPSVTGVHLVVPVSTSSTLV